MGIRFYCPSGHRLNVKAFLAGKRGICPKCGVKVRIPEEAETLEKKVEPTLEMSHSGKDAGNNHHASSRLPNAVANSTRHEKNQQVTRRLEVSNELASENLSPPSNANDPFTEMPHVVWYVRPTKGGQFGPATSEIMRKWVAEGRVREDSLVWREDWSEWRTARLLFPLSQDDGNPKNVSIASESLFFSKLAEPLPNPIQVSAEVNSPMKSGGRTIRRRSKQYLSLMAVIILMMAIMGLLPVLIHVLMKS